MSFKSRTSPIALAAAFAFAMGSTAFAATMVGDQEVSDAELPSVTAHCESLTGDMAATDSTADVDQDTTASIQDNAAEAPAPKDSATVDDASGQTVDLAAITAEDCEAAGL